MRCPLRAGPTLPGMGLFLSRNRKRQFRLLAQIQGPATRGGTVLRVRGARDRRHRAEKRSGGVRRRSKWRRLPAFRTAGRPERQSLRKGLRSRGRLPRLDVCATGLCRLFGRLLSQEPHHAARAQAMLHFRGGAVVLSLTPLASICRSKLAWRCGYAMRAADERCPRSSRLGQL
jgi:hypothetical protein